MKQTENFKKQAKITWGTNPVGWAHAQDLTPGTKAFFEKVLQERFTVEYPFSVFEVDIKKLKPKDLPASQHLGPLYMKLPQWAQRFLEHNFGWYLSVKVGRT